MSNEQEFVEKYLKNPSPLTSLESMGNWSNYLTLLHILLVKHGIKKTHLIINEKSKSVINKNNLKLSKKLKVSMKKRTPIYSTSLCYETDIFNHETIVEIIKGSAHNMMIIGYSVNDETFNDFTNLNTKIAGKLSEYPECCIKWMIKNQIWDLETAFRIFERINKNENNKIFENFGNIAELVHHLIQISHDDTYPPILSRRVKINHNQMVKGRQKFPFCFHQPCDECLNKEKSPTVILNEKYKRFTKNTFPELYDVIIKGSKAESEKYLKIEQRNVTDLKEIGYLEESNDLKPLTNLDGLLL